MRTDLRTARSTVETTACQEPFARIAPFLGAALLLGTGGGFTLAAVLTLTQLLQLPLGTWWVSIAQAHGHLQLYGWAGLFVLGVLLHFLPRLRGTPLAAPRLVPWILLAQVAGLLLRALSQPLFVATGAATWSVLLIASGALECLTLVGVVFLFGKTIRYGPSLATRPAFRGVLPFLVGALILLGVASCVNLLNVAVATTTTGLVPGASDELNVTLGLFGFLVPIALAMSAQSLPMYAGREAIPRRILWPLAGVYFTGCVLTSVGISDGSQQARWATLLEGLGMLLMGIVLLIFIGVFLRMMRSRGRLPQRIAQLASSPEAAARTYQRRIKAERNSYGPFVALVASAYLWAALGGVLLTVDGVTILLGAAPIFAIDVIRHSLAVGFITLLICGIAPRMVPGFLGGNIVSPTLVRATLWLGNTAALLRVGSLLLAPLLVYFNRARMMLVSVAFGLSGPTGLALAFCLTVNLWPALRSQRNGRSQ